MIPSRQGGRQINPSKALNAGANLGCLGMETTEMDRERKYTLREAIFWIYYIFEQCLGEPQQLQASFNLTSRFNNTNNL